MGASVEQEKKQKKKIKFQQKFVEFLLFSISPHLR